MDFRKNIKYFESNDVLFIIGIVLLVIGVVLFAMAELFWLYLFPIQVPVGLVLAVGGAALAFIPRSMRSNESDLDAYVASALEGYSEKAADDLGIPHGTGIKPTLVGGYVVDREGLLIRRGSGDRKIRSSLYTAAAFLFTRNGICVACKTFSLIAPEVSEKTSEFLYSEITHAALGEEAHTVSMTGDTETVKVSYFILYAGEREVFRIPTANSAVVSKICEDINVEIARQKA